jgi:uncharacterized membrane protein YdjX (TVP38/TMEM64 family)
MTKEKRKWVKPVLLLLVIAGAIVALRALGITEYFSRENIGELRQQVENLGIWGPLAYIGVYILACIFFIPGLAITLVAGIFGAVNGTIYVSIASTIGASLCFLIARYAMRPMVENWAAKNPVFQKIDDGVEQQGWRMVMITRLVPLFPFNLQNYAYGLTKVKFLTYVLVSWICMLPATIAYVFASGSIIEGEGEIGKTLTYLAVAAVFFVMLSFLPKCLRKKFKVDPVEPKAV